MRLRKDFYQLSSQLHGTLYKVKIDGRVSLCAARCFYNVCFCRCRCQDWWVWPEFATWMTDALDFYHIGGEFLPKSKNNGKPIPQYVRQSLKPHKWYPSIVFGPSDLTNRYPWKQPSPDCIPVTFATAASHPLPLYDEVYDSNTYAVGVGGDAVTQQGRWHGDSLALGCRKHKADQNGSRFICAVSLWERRTWRGSREWGGRPAFFTSSKIRRIVIDFPMTCPTPQNTPPFGVRRLAWWTCTPSRMQTRSSKTWSPTPHLGPATTPSSPISPWLSPSPRSPCLIYAFAEQLLPRELREQHSHLSTLVTRCHLLLPAHRTSRQTMPHAFWTSDLRRLPQRGLGGALDSESHGWWSSKPRPQWHLQLVCTHT